MTFVKSLFFIQFLKKKFYCGKSNKMYLVSHLVPQKVKNLQCRRPEFDS